MEILLRQYDGKYYVWKDAEFKKDGYYINGERFEYTDILDVKTEDTSTYVTCVYCGAMIKNTPEDIEAHFKEMESKRDCFSCKVMQERNIAKRVVKYIKNEDGTYNANATYDTTLRCGNAWCDIDALTTDLVHQCCTYYQCRRRGVRSCNNIFATHPNLFETQITVDLLLAKGYKYNEHNYRGFFEYDLKMRGNLVACANEVGIVDSFYLRYRTHRYTLYYSQKYDKLFYENRGNYVEGVPYGVTAVKWDQLKTKIKSLYMEAENE